MYQNRLPIVRIQHFNKSNRRPYLLIHSVDRHGVFHISRHSIKSAEYQKIMDELKDIPFIQENDFDLYELE